MTRLKCGHKSAFSVPVIIRKYYCCLTKPYLTLHHLTNLASCTLTLTRDTLQQSLTQNLVGKSDYHSLKKTKKKIRNDQKCIRECAVQERQQPEFLDNVLDLVKFSGNFCIGDAPLDRRSRSSRHQTVQADSVAEHDLTLQSHFYDEGTKKLDLFCNSEKSFHFMKTVQLFGRVVIINDEPGHQWVAESSEEELKQILKNH